LLFSLREATSESYGPSGLVSIILLSILFAFAFVPNVSDLNNISLCIKNPSTFHLSPYRQGLDNPLIALGVEICFLVCRGRTRGVARTSFWFDTLVLNSGKYFAACYIILSASRNNQRETSISGAVPGKIHKPSSIYNRPPSSSIYVRANSLTLPGQKIATNRTPQTQPIRLTVRHPSYMDHVWQVLAHSFRPSCLAPAPPDQRWVLVQGPPSLRR
jgi:hypothetical protein